MSSLRCFTFQSSSAFIFTSKTNLSQRIEIDIKKHRVGMASEMPQRARRTHLFCRLQRCVLPTVSDHDFVAKLTPSALQLSCTKYRCALQQSLCLQSYHLPAMFTREQVI
jgi:hypothetical protein